MTALKLKHEDFSRALSIVCLCLWIGWPARCEATSKTLMFDSPLTLRLKQNGFTCEGRIEGSICVIPKISDQNFSYPEPVAFVIPRHVQSPYRPLLYLLGHRGVCEKADLSPAAFIDRYRLLEQIAKAQPKSSVLILPFSQGKNETYAKFLQGKMPAFFGWVQAQLESPKIDKWILAGHSGAGKWLAYLLEEVPELNSATSGVFLLDATYAVKSQIPRWRSILERNPRLQIFSAVVPKSQTAKETAILLNSLPKNRVLHLPVPEKNHCNLPATQLETLLKLLP